MDDARLVQDGELAQAGGGRELGLDGDLFGRELGEMVPVLDGGLVGDGVLVVGGEGGWDGALLQPYELVVWKGGQKVLGGEGDEVWESGKEKQLGWVLEVLGVVEEGQLSVDGELQVEERCELLVQEGDEVG